MARTLMVLFFCMMVVWWPNLSLAGELKLLNAAICKEISQHAPVDAGDTFGADVQKLFCYTRIVGPYHIEKRQHIVHVWYYGDEERARIDLQIKSSNWGTYSSKIIQPHEVGKWHVDVLDALGEQITTLPFLITE